MKTAQRVPRLISVITLYGILSVTFVVLLSLSMDSHFDYAIHERIHFGGSVFTASRVFSPTMVRLLTETGLPEKTAALTYIAIASITLLFVFGRLLMSWGGISEEKSIQFAPLILLPMVWNYIVLSSIHYLDDVPAVLFFTLGLLALSEKKLFRFHLVFLTAIINRETAVFLVPAMFLMQFGKRKTPLLLVHSLALIAAAFAVKLFLNNLVGAVSSVPASMYEAHFSDNMAILKSMISGNTQDLRMLMTFGGLWLLLPFITGKIRSDVMLMTVLLPIFFTGMVFVGNLSDEARIFNEMIPVVTVPCILFLEARQKSGT